MPGLAVALALLIAILFAAGCGSAGSGASSPDASRVVTDDLGKEVELPHEVSRAVSLAPNITEIAFAVGAGEKLVGVTTFCNYPKEANSVKRVGDTLKPNIESIVALKPQVVLVSTASQLEAFVPLLERQGIGVFVTNPNSLEDVYRSIRKIGEVLNREDSAVRLVAGLKARISRVRQNVKSREPVRVFVQIDKSLYTVGEDSYITELIELAGGSSVTKEVKTAYPKISRERARALDPEVIVLSESPDNDRPNDVFDESRAVRNGRVIRIDADVLSRPGPRIVNAVEQLAKGLHGKIR